MSFISVFDVLGPNMIGPSSSHTAGAAAIALLAGKMPNAAIKKAVLAIFYCGFGWSQTNGSSTDLLVSMDGGIDETINTMAWRM